MAERSLAGGRESGSFVNRHAWAPYLLIAAAMLFWSGDIIVVRAARFDIPPIGLVFWQCLVAIVVLFPLIYGKIRAQMPILKRHWKTMLLFGVLQAVTGQALLYIGVHNTPAVNAGLLVATMPIVVIVLAWIILRDRITLLQGGAVALALVGITAIMTEGNFTTVLEVQFAKGDLWVECAILSFSLYTVLVKKLMPEGLNPFVLFQAMVTCAVIVLFPFYVAEIVLTPGRVEFNLMTLAVVLYIAVFGWILALVCYNVAVAHIGPGKAGMFSNLSPVFTVILAVALLGETLSPHHYLGMVFVFLGVYLASRGGRTDPAY